jgi:hypothetical protein
MKSASTSDLMVAREDAAAELEATIVVAGAALQKYDRFTAALAELTGELLAWQLDPVPISLHLVAAGFARFVERKVQVAGTLISLRSLVEGHHQRLSVKSSRV